MKKYYRIKNTLLKNVEIIKITLVFRLYELLREKRNYVSTNIDFPCFRNSYIEIMSEEHAILTSSQ